MLRPDITSFQQSLYLDRVYIKGTASPQNPAKPLRLMSWNVERGHKPDKLAHAIAAIRPDVACLQEVDWGNDRTSRKDVLAFLAEATGMIGLFGIEFLELPSPRRPAKFAGGGVTGNALLTRLPPVETFRVELPPSLDWQDSEASEDLPQSARRAVRTEKRIGRRFGLGAEFQIGHRKLRVCSLHLEDKYGGVRGRWAQYMAAVEAMEGRSRETTATVIAGDFNTFDSRLARLRTPDNDETALGKPPGMTEAAWWKSALLPRSGYGDPFPDNSWTFAAPPFFKAKLDWITTKGCFVRGFDIGPFSSSDHRPIWADLEFPDG